MNEVNAFTLPLNGLSLIEASAGTGKTTTLVRLYLRALLVAGLNVEQILAVTYTRAATGELSLRIRKALADAAVQLQAEAPQAFWAELFALAGGDKDLLKKRIDAALAAFDEKAVFTIHGFCQRMLADNAFEAAEAFASTPSDDEDALRAEAAADFWRRRTGDAAPAYARWFTGTFESPKGLLKVLYKALSVSGALQIEPEVNAEIIKRAEAGFTAAADAAVKEWQKASERLLKFMQERPGVSGVKYKDASVKRVLSDWQAWLADAATPDLPENFKLLTASHLGDSMNKGKSAPDEPFFAAADALQQSAERRAALWWQEGFAAAFHFISDELRRRKRQIREIGYDDMLANLRDALDAVGGRTLAVRIAKRYPLILVDEFQDTDPLQHEIFMRIHAAGDAHGLILIGDPKQAIYRFRGADIFTYMQVRAECEKTNRVYGLTHNYRSTLGLLDALNSLFEGSENPFEYAEIPYVHVSAGTEIAPLAAGQDAPLTLLWQPAAENDKGGKITKDEAVRRSADICATEIVRLLESGADGNAHYEGNPVQAKDIAVLVNDNKQGGLMQRTLRRRGIAAVAVSRASVFASDEAGELQTVLAAVAEPANGRLLRRALATSLLGKTATELAALAADESRWGGIVAEFRKYCTHWQTRGFARMFAALLVEQGVIERTLAREDGERVMTDLRHLAELAGEQAMRHPGIAPLLAWFARERDSAVQDEARQLRLESDENLVRIATVHKAKGLQYPIVFLPFLWDGRKANERDAAVLAHDEDYRAVLDLGSEVVDTRRTEAEREARAEEARKTYVALTRAERACYLIALPANQLEQSALARLLNVSEVGEFEAKLRAWGKAVPGAVTMRAPVTAGHLSDDAVVCRHGEARAFEHTDRLQQRFHVASYSLLAAGASGGAAEQPDWDESVQVAPAVEAATGIHAFPAGAASGIFLHAVIEALDFAADAATIEATVKQLCATYGFDAYWIEILTTWLRNLFATALGSPACTLADISAARRINELEFYFPLKRIHAESLDKAVAGFAPQTPRPALHFNPVAGQMKGYMDLVFEHDGRYWIADYKSNRLGGNLDAYTPEALDRAMAEHRYDLQYLIYTVALHRYLETRISDYDYERHFGGVLYLFLRGMAPDAPAPCGVWYTRPAWKDVQRLNALLAGGADE
ncbi:MAG: exodeoxyribonuclease V subunit beta [Gammaproteobacteria bacterium]